MTKQEIKLIEAIIDNLIKSTKTSWSSGGLHEWADYAKEMKLAILHNMQTLKSLVDHTEQVAPLKEPAIPESTEEVLDLFRGMDVVEPTSSTKAVRWDGKEWS